MGWVQRAEAFTPRVVERSDVSIATRITVANRPRAITLINISSHGFMGECPAGVPLKSRVSLDLPGLGPLAGCVRWAVGRRVGGRFDTPLDDAELDRAIAAASDAGTDAGIAALEPANA